MRVPFFIVVEQEEYENYASVIDYRRIIILPKEYLKNYDTCDLLGRSKPVGPGAARNFCWDHSSTYKFERHWVMDDNLDAFHRLNRNIKAEVESGTIFRCMEDFVDRYENVALAGPNYYSFCKTTDALPAFVLNTRIYSCILVKNDIPYRWRARYNEDTDLSLRVLKDGLCTIQFNAFLQGKTTTQRMSGGNTEAFYKEEGTIQKSQMLADLHPDVAKVVKKFNRWHHHVDYSPFRDNKLIRKGEVEIPEGVDNYGLVLIDIKRGEENVRHHIS